MMMISFFHDYNLINNIKIIKYYIYIYIMEQDNQKNKPKKRGRKGKNNSG